MDISILIVSFNAKELLRTCIKSIYETTRYVDFEIIVVDNGSNDGSPEMIEAEFKDIKLERNRENVGFARANNQAMKIASGKYILLLNSDAIVKEKTMETLIQFMKTHPKAAAVGPKVIHPGGVLQSKGEQFPHVGKSFLDLLRVSHFLKYETLCKLLPRFYWSENISKSVDWLIGCCLLIRRESFEKIGPFSERFFIYGEETEWCYRAKKHHFEIWYVAEAEVVHLGEGSYLQSRSEWRQKGIAFFYKMTVGRMRGIIITINNILFFYTRLLSVSLRSTKISGYELYKCNIRQELNRQIGLLKLLVAGGGLRGPFNNSMRVT